MAFRFDMQGKTFQQQMIVSKRDDEDKRRKQEAAKIDAKKVIAADDNTQILPLDIDKESCPALRMDFEDFLHTIKRLTYNGINCRLSRLRWVEDSCEQSAAILTSDIQIMYKSRAIIYQKADSPHKAGNYYNALMLYYEYVHGKECPRINNKELK